MKRETSRHHNIKTYRPKESLHDVIIRYVALIVIIMLFIMDIYYKITFDYYAESYAALGIFILFGKQDLLAILRIIKKW